MVKTSTTAGKKTRPFRNFSFAKKTGTEMATLQSTDELVCNWKLADALMQTVRDLKMLPRVAIKAIAIADDPDASVRDFAKVVSQDLKLTAGILAFANSPLFPVFAAGSKVTCLETAITRLGFRQVRQMILVSSYSSMVQSLPTLEEATREKLNEHGFLVGCICSELNRLFGLRLQGEEFTAGIIHDVGRILVAATIGESFRQVDPLDFDESSEDFLADEMKLMGTNHARIGAWFLRRNQLPEELINVAMYHHCPNDSAQYTRLVALVAIADDLANYYHRDPNQVTEYEPSGAASTKLLEMLGAGQATKKFEDNWPEVLQRSVETCQQILV